MNEKFRYPTWQTVIHYAKRPYQVAAIPASNFGGLGFEIRPVNRIYRRVFVRFYELQEITFKRIWMLLHVFRLMTHKNHFNTTGNVRINAILGRIR